MVGAEEKRRPTIFYLKNLWRKIKKKKQLTYLALAGAMALMACGSLLCGNSIVSYENVVGKTQTYSEYATEGISPMSGVCEDILQPSVSGPVRHNCVIAYNIRQNDPHATRVEFLRGGSERYPSFTYYMSQGTSRTIVGISDGSSLSCGLSVFVVRAKCPDCGNSSDITIGNQGGYPVYEVYETKTYGTIGTAYDKDGYVWKHGLSTGNTIHFSIVYRGQIADGSITIPWIGMKTVGPFYLDGVDFWVRTGPNKISIKASQDVACNNYDTVFSFSTSQDAINI